MIGPGTRMEAVRLHADAHRGRSSRSVRRHASVSRLGCPRPRLPPAGALGPVQGPARAQGRGRGPHPPGGDRHAAGRPDGQRRRIPVEEHDRPARPPPAVPRATGIRTPPTAGASSTSSTSARRPGFLPVVDLNMDETPQDMADFVEYANGPADSEWGRRRVQTAIRSRIG